MPHTIIKLPEVQRQTALSRTEIYRKIQANNFPSPIKLGLRASGWVEKEIQDWITAQINKSRPNSTEASQ
jgi:prophage regulatory protein